MPPQRTITPAKPIKTERTHEENQERAYIAASRRSDRSLEARVESARRASEIHKRRTGRSLRVTEQDVINEEMYEEEDDDLPMQYRRLTAHLQTGSADFNRRLAAYLTNHVAMRSALDQAITHSYAQQFPNAPQFAHNQPSYPSPFSTPDMSQTQQTADVKAGESQTKGQSMKSPSIYRSTPYPTAGSVGYRPNQNRSASIATTHDVPGFMQNFSQPKSINQMDPLIKSERRMSTPASNASPFSPRTPQLPQTKLNQSTSSSNEQGANHNSSQTQDNSAPRYPPNADFGPLQISLPLGSQMMLGSYLDPNDPMTSKLMAGSEFLPQSFMNGFGNAGNFNSSHLNGFSSKDDSSFGGINETLAPSALDINPQFLNFDNYGSSMSAPASTINPNFPGNLGDFKGLNVFNTLDSSQGSGQVTPGEAGWNAFINSDSWTENGT
ncbi:hypothetical protein MMC25_004683 [Agyrium rufum]|nr:hypothetical protein [Agyrium rufum]